ncbi:MAG: TIGR04086 family membrane protein [Syntrophomonadaceae bacterium]|nr:TIGR04086 family membrane protein [Syntrophomonadaceae bacterium]
MHTKHPVIRGVLVGVLLSGLLGILTGLLLHLTTLPELSASLSITALALILFVGGLTAAYRAGGRGLLVGSEVALVFIVLMFAATLIFYPGQLAWKTAITKSIVSLLAGALGGVVGVAIRTR